MPPSRLGYDRGQRAIDATFPDCGRRPLLTPQFALAVAGTAAAGLPGQAARRVADHTEKPAFVFALRHPGQNISVNSRHATKVDVWPPRGRGQAQPSGLLRRWSVLSRDLSAAR